MRRIISLIFIIIPLCIWGQKAKIDFSETSHNFGNINEKGGNAVYEFVFKNSGTTPLILNDVKTGCGCTTSEWSKQPVLPGASGKIKVSFDPIARPGAFMKSITVYSNAEAPIVSLVIKGNVTRKPAGPYDAYLYIAGPVRLMTENINLGSISNTQQIEKNIEAVNSESKVVTLTANSPGQYAKVTVTPTKLKKGDKATIRIVYDASAKQDWGFVSDKIDLLVDNQVKGSLIVSANIYEDFSKYNKSNFADAPIAVFSTKDIALGNLAPNTTKTHEFSIQNNGKSDLIIRKIRPSDESMTVTPATNIIKPGKEAKIKIELKTEKETGSKIKFIAFILNDPKNTVTNYRLTYDVN